MLSWDTFSEKADDSVLLLVFAYLNADCVLNLALASLSAAQRLAGAGAGVGEAMVAQHRMVEQAGATSQSVAQHFATGLLGREAAAAAAAAAARARHAAGCAASGSLEVLRMLVSRTPAAWALNLAVAIAQAGQDPLSWGTPAADAGLFLDMLFSFEMKRLRSARNNKKKVAPAPAQAAEAALATLMSTGNGGCNLLRMAAAAVRKMETDLDELVSDGRIGIPGSYEAVARRRSAAEFLRRCIDAAVDAPPGGAAAGARKELDSAVRDLDETIAGYVKEGYELSCPRVTGGFARSAVPYTHWWVHLGRAYSEGWAVLAH